MIEIIKVYPDQYLELDYLDLETKEELLLKSISSQILYNKNIGKYINYYIQQFGLTNELTETIESNCKKNVYFFRRFLDDSTIENYEGKHVICTKILESITDEDFKFHIIISDVANLNISPKVSTSNFSILVQLIITAVNHDKLDYVEKFLHKNQDYKKELLIHITDKLLSKSSFESLKELKNQNKEFNSIIEAHLISSQDKEGKYKLWREGLLPFIEIDLYHQRIVGYCENHNRGYDALKTDLIGQWRLTKNEVVKYIDFLNYHYKEIDSELTYKRITKTVYPLVGDLNRNPSENIEDLKEKIKSLLSNKSDQYFTLRAFIDDFIDNIDYKKHLYLTSILDSKEQLKLFRKLLKLTAESKISLTI